MAGPAVRASGYDRDDVFGVGQVIAAAIIGDTGARFPAAEGSLPTTARAHRSLLQEEDLWLSQRGSRHLNHDIHMAAVTQIAPKHCDG